jgi:shikimate dehydrogenase
VAPLGAVGRVVDPTEVAGPLAAADIVVNATTVGMGNPGPDDVPVDPAPLHAGQLVVDIVYRPLETPLLAAARRQGAAVVNGVPMLVHQAAVAFELWTGVPAPVEEMSLSVADHLS